MVNSTFPLLQSLKDPLFLKEVANQPLLVEEIQFLLKEGGFYLGAVDGILGRQSIASFVAFKNKAFLEFPDTLGKSTAVALLELDGSSKHPSPQEATQIIPGAYKRKSICLPGNKVVYCDQPIAGCQDFTWAEATKNGTRVPLNTPIVKNIIELAEYLELVKAVFDDKTIIITSWYRPPEVNLQQGGVPNSQHLLGRAVDFLVQGVAPVDVYRRLNNWHGARGGLGNSRAFTHLDRRGYAARFTYG